MLTSFSSRCPRPHVYLKAAERFPFGFTVAFVKGDSAGARDAEGAAAKEESAKTGVEATTSSLAPRLELLRELLAEYSLEGVGIEVACNEQLLERFLRLQGTPRAGVCGGVAVLTEHAGGRKRRRLLNAALNRAVHAAADVNGKGKAEEDALQRRVHSTLLQVPPLPLLHHHHRPARGVPNRPSAGWMGGILAAPLCRGGSCWEWRDAYPVRSGVVAQHKSTL